MAMVATMTAAIVAQAVLPACAAHHRVTVTGREIHRHVEELRGQGSAVVDATETVDDGKPRDVRESIRADQVVTAAGTQRRIDDLMRNCADAPPFREDRVSNRDCGLVRLGDTPLQVREFDTRRAQPALGYAITGVLGVAVVGSVTCEFACPDDSTLKLASDITLGTLAASFVGLLVYALISCFGHWGEPGCRD